MSSPVRGYASVVIDVDSTLCGVEGIDWLAEQASDGAGERIAELTARAMSGEVPLEAVYGHRLALVRPGVDDLAALSRAYAAALAPGAPEAMKALRHAGRRVVLVSGGLREAILPLAEALGVPAHDVHAVGVRMGEDGEYLGFDTQSPLATATGKRDVVQRLGLPRRILAVGDGATDLAMREAVDAFAAFTGFVRREPVVAAADLVVTSFDHLVEVVLA